MPSTVVCTLNVPSTDCAVNGVSNVLNTSFGLAALTKRVLQTYFLPTIKFLKEIVSTNLFALNGFNSFNPFSKVAVVLISTGLRKFSASSLMTCPSLSGAT